MNAPSSDAHTPMTPMTVPLLLANQRLMNVGVAMYIQNAADAPYSTPYTFHCHGSVNQAQASEAKPKTAAAAVITQRGLNLEMSLPATGVQIAATHGWRDMYSVASVRDQPNSSMTGDANKPAWFATTPKGMA